MSLYFVSLLGFDYKSKVIIFFPCRSIYILAKPPARGSTNIPNIVCFYLLYTIETTWSKFRLSTK